MPSSSEKLCNPVQYVYKGVQVRKYNTIRIRVDEKTYKEIIDTGIDTGLSTRKILAHSSKPCERCIDKPVVVLTDNGEVNIKRGILSKRIPISYGNSNRANCRTIIDTETGAIFKSIKEVADLIKMKYTTLLDQLNNRSKNTTKFKFHEQGN